jgi:hypothetical protein
MSLYAFEPMVTPAAGFARYDDLPRRLVRLAHIAAVMLPLLNVAIGPWLDRLALSPRLSDAASRLLLFGAVGLPAALVAEAFVPSAAAWHVSGIPAVAFVAALGIVAVGAARTDFTDGGVHAHDVDRPHGDRDRRAALQDVAGPAPARHPAP